MFANPAEGDPRESVTNLNAAEPERQKLPSPKRITITVPYETYQRLVLRSDNEGRSLSNLSAFLLESCVGRNSQA